MELRLVMPEHDGESFIVEFPGYISDPEATEALKTLGGTSGIQQQRQEHPKNLKLKLRPDDDYCHPLTSNDVKKTNSFLLRVRTGPEKQLLVSEGLLTVQQVYKFFTPADIQMGSSKHRLTAEEGNSMKCAPPRFSVESSLEYVFEAKSKAVVENGKFERRRSQDGSHAAVGGDGGAAVGGDGGAVVDGDGGAVVDGDGGGAVDGDGSGAVDDDDGAAVDGDGGAVVDGDGGAVVDGDGGAVVDGVIWVDCTSSRIPGPISREDKDNIGRLLESSIMDSLCKIFHERPVLVDAAVVKAILDQNHTNRMSYDFVRRALQLMCYKFRDGPWRGAWVRRGYDPRSTQQAAPLQVIALTRSTMTGNCIDDTIDGDLETVGLEYRRLMRLELHSYKTDRLYLLQVGDVEELSSSVLSEEISLESGWYTSDSWKDIIHNVLSRLNSRIGEPKFRLSTAVQALHGNTLPNLLERQRKRKDSAANADITSSFKVLPAEYASMMKLFLSSSVKGGKNVKQHEDVEEEEIDDF